MTSSDGFHDFAYDTLSQWLEGTLTLVFVIWCFRHAAVGLEGPDAPARSGDGAVAARLCGSALGDQPGGRCPTAGVLKLLFMPVMVWLLLESRKPSSRAPLVGNG
jgi:hypothetical protein